jgi:hypothetical protein
MKQVIILIALLVSESFTFPGGHSITTDKAKSYKRDILFTAVKSFASDISSMDTKRLKPHFNFPVTDGNIWYLTGINDLLLNENTENFKPFNESDFDKYYIDIFTQQPCNLSLLFKTVKIDSLAYEEMVKGYASFMPMSKDMCYCYYSAWIDTENLEVIFNYGTTPRSDYSGDGCRTCFEFYHTWTFKLVNGCLVFDNLYIAE